MKKSNKATVFIMVMILITLSMIVAYIVFEGMTSMDSNLLFSRNERELNRNLQQKAEINFRAMEKFYLDGDRTNNDFSRLNLLSIVPANSEYYNVFWNTSELVTATIENPLNSGSTVSIPSGKVAGANGRLHLSLSSSSPLNYSIKLVEFSKTIYDDTGILVLSGKVSESSPNMTTTSGYIRDNLSLQALPVPMVTSAKPFDFMNSNFALFIKNNGTESINVSISGADTSGKKIYLSGMNESNADSSTGVITNLVNHVIISGENYIGRHNLASVHGRTISWYGKCDTGGKILSPKSIYGKGTEDECSDTDIIVCTGDNTGYTMSSCNVGATLAGTGSDSYGNFFQWGNNYRFPNTGAVSTSTGLINTTDYGPENPYSSDTFITLYGGWSLSQNDNLWGGEGDMATLNGPGTDEGRQGACPVGYHIPSTLDWKLLVSNWFESKGETCNPSVGDSCSWYGNTSLLHFQSDLKIPLAGFLTYSDGSLKSPGDIGYYWSSSPIDTSFVHTLYLLPSYVFPQFKNGYSVAFSVRCFRNTSKFFNN